MAVPDEWPGAGRAGVAVLRGAGEHCVQAQGRGGRHGHLLIPQRRTRSDEGREVC